MPNNPKQLFRGAATTTTTTTLYTVPASTTTIVTEVLAVNNNAATASFTLSLNGVVAAPTVTIAANDTTRIPLNQVLTAGQTITGGASATTVLLHIAGVEVS